jgi:hypothetical protein
MCPPPPPPPPPEDESVSSPSRSPSPSPSPSPKEPEILEEPTVKPSEVVQREDAGRWDLVECYPLLKQKEYLHAVSLIPYSYTTNL